MHIGAIQTWCKHVKAQSEVWDLPDEIQIYHKFDGNWLDENRIELEDAGLIKRLESRLQSGDHWRATNATWSYFPVAYFDAVLRANFHAPTKVTRRKKIQKKIESLVTIAQHEFDANHQDLTGLPNRKRLDAILEQSIPLEDAFEDASAKKLSASRDDHTFSMIAIDVDDFKQVNDSNNHQYGDVVLRCVGSRLQECSREISDLDQIDLTVAHPSGEEFCVLVSGSIGSLTIEEIAEKFRLTISNGPLPSADEWSRERRNNLVSDDLLPDEDSRNVTISLGTTTKVATRQLCGHNLASRLKSDADRALSRAKKDGKNCVRKHEEIVRKHGRVLENIDNSNIIIIDVGAEDGVMNGQEFDVYLPPFIGSVPYLVSDGRTTRKMGTYPQVSSGSIEVFDVQPEIAFGRIKKIERDVKLVKGARLKAIPAGTLAHLLTEDEKSKFAEGEVGLDVELDLSDVTDACRSHVEKIDAPVALVVGIGSHVELIETLGVSKYNDAFAKLYQCVSRKVPDSAIVWKLDDSALLFLVDDESFANKIENMRVSISAQMPRGVNVRFGSYRAPKADLPGTVGQSHDAEFAPILARFAFWGASLFDRKYIKYTDEYAWCTVSALRNDREKDLAILSYEWLRDHEVNSGPLENVGGLCLLEHGDRFAEAKLAFLRAVNLAPLDVDYWNNLGLVECLLGHYRESAEAFSKSEELNSTVSLNEFYRTARNISAFEDSVLVAGSHTSLQIMELFGRIDSKWLSGKYFRHYEERYKSFAKLYSSSPNSIAPPLTIVQS